MPRWPVSPYSPSGVFGLAFEMHQAQPAVHGAGDGEALEQGRGEVSVGPPARCRGTDNAVAGRRSAAGWCGGAIEPSGDPWGSSAVVWTVWTFAGHSAVLLDTFRVLLDAMLDGLDTQRGVDHGHRLRVARVLLEHVPFGLNHQI
jgi:hypothetical protein